METWNGDPYEEEEEEEEDEDEDEEEGTGLLGANYP
jgi:hypothetical protein